MKSALELAGLALLLLVAALVERGRSGLELRLIAAAILLLASAVGARSRGARALLALAVAALPAGLAVYPLGWWSLAAAGGAALAAALLPGEEAESASLFEEGTALLAALAAMAAFARRAHAWDPLMAPLAVLLVEAFGPGAPRTGAGARRRVAGFALLAAAALLRGYEAGQATIDPERLLLGLAWLLAAEWALEAHLQGSSARACLVPATLLSWIAAVAAARGNGGLAIVAAALCLALPLGLAERRSERGRELARRAVQGLGLGAAAWALVAVVAWTRAVRPTVGGVDGFFYICFGRDLATVDAALVPEFRYVYFPGVYAFWRAAVTFLGDVPVRLQWAYVAALAVNALLAGAIVARVATRRLGAGLFAALFTIKLLACLEGIEACAEPLITLPALAGLLVSGGTPLVGRRGAALALALGVGFGLTVWVKQQGLLLGAGGVALVLLALPRGERRAEPRLLVLAGVAALATFALAIACEGHGLEPIRRAFGHYAIYPEQGSFFENLRTVSSHAGGFAWALGATVMLAMLWPIAALSVRARPHLDARATVAGFAALAATGTLVQFTKRGYAHYALLTAPFIAIATTLAADALLARRARPLGSLAALAVAAILLAGTGRDGPYDLVWPGAAFTPKRPWYQEPVVAADIERLREHVPRGTELVVLPPRGNAIHFLLGTRSHASRLAYGWAPEFGFTMEEPHVRWDAIEAVVVLERPRDRVPWDELQCGDALSNLERRGFERALALETLTLWRRRKAH